MPLFLCISRSRISFTDKDISKDVFDKVLNVTEPSGIESKPFLPFFINSKELACTFMMLL